MRLIWSVLLLILSINAFTDDSGFRWRRIDAPGVKLMYKSGTYPNTFLSHMEDADNSYDLQQFRPEAYVEALPQLRQSLNQLLQISDYKVLKHTARQSAESWEVRLEGSYQRRGKELIQFCEIHTFAKAKSGQKQLLIPAALAEKALSGSDCFKVLERQL
jgi:hypothetical protein